LAIATNCGAACPWAYTTILLSQRNYKHQAKATSWRRRFFSVSLKILATIDKELDNAAAELSPKPPQPKENRFSIFSKLFRTSNPEEKKSTAETEKNDETSTPRSKM
jgi:hypothetical protein